MKYRESEKSETAKEENSPATQLVGGKGTNHTKSELLPTTLHITNVILVKSLSPMHKDWFLGLLS